MCFLNAYGSTALEIVTVGSKIRTRPRKHYSIDTPQYNLPSFCLASLFGITMIELFVPDSRYGTAAQYHDCVSSRFFISSSHGILIKVRSDHRSGFCWAAAAQLPPCCTEARLGGIRSATSRCRVDNNLPSCSEMSMWP